MSVPPGFPNDGSFGKPNDPSRGKLTAEERLLQVIQDGGESIKLGRGSRWGDVSRWLSRFSPARIQAALKARWPGPLSLKSALKSALRLDLAWVNKALGTVSGLGLVLAVGNVFYPKLDIGRVYSQVERTHAPSGEHAVPQPVQVDEYVASITGRNLFRAASAPAPVAGTEAPPPVASPVMGTVDDMQLVGIAWGVYPEAMIRDKKGGRTHFLKQGERLRDVLVKEILRDRVIVESGGQPKELM